MKGDARTDTRGNDARNAAVRPLRPTIRDVARLAGVAVGTVSRVLNGAPNVRPAHLAGVHEAMARLDYAPRPPGAPRGHRARKPAPRRTFQIAFLSPGIYGSLIHMPVYLEVLHGVQAAAEGNGLTVVLGTDHPETRREGGALRARVDGAVTLGLDRACARQLTRGAPCVQVMGLSIAAEDERDQVTYDNAAIGPLAARYLLGRGHRHCAFLGDGTTTVFEGRRQGFLAEARRAGVAPLLLDASGMIMVRDGMNVTDTVRLRMLCDRLMRSVPSITGLFAEADHWLGPLYAMLYPLGLLPGRDIDVIGCNREVPLLNALHPRPATIDIHAREIGRRAVERLIERMADPVLPPARIVLAPEVTPGGNGD